MEAKQGSTPTKQQLQAGQPPPAGEFDPKFEWIESPAGYALRLDLQGFKKDDFRVQVDSVGRLTVRGQRASGGGKLHKVFQLPPAASLDDINGRFEAGVLTLTVPKRAAAVAPTTVEEIKKPRPVAKEEAGAALKPPPKDLVDGAEKKDTAAAVKPKEEITKQVDADVKKKKEESSFKKAMDLAARNAQQQQQEAPKQEQTPTPTPAQRTTGDVKPKAPSEKAARPEATGEKAKATVDRESLAERVRRRAEEAEREKKPKAPTEKPEVKATVDRDSLLEKVRQRAEEERAKAAVAEEAEGEKKTPACGGWKERVAAELEELADMKWADGLVEMARNNKEVVATAIAAFSLGFLVSHKLFSRN